jgi:hypothetical protein
MRRWMERVEGDSKRSSSERKKGEWVDEGRGSWNGSEYKRWER